MAGINRPNDLLTAGGTPQSGAQGPPPGAAPQGGPQAGVRPPQGAGPPQGGGMNPGGMQAVKAGIQQLLKMGLDEEQIVEAILKLAAESGLDIPEEQIRALIEQTASGQGDAPQGGVPQAPAGAPPINLPANL